MVTEPFALQTKEEWTNLTQADDKVPSSDELEQTSEILLAKFLQKSEEMKAQPGQGSLKFKTKDVADGTSVCVQKSTCPEDHRQLHLEQNHPWVRFIPEIEWWRLSQVKIPNNLYILVSFI